MVKVRRRLSKESGPIKVKGSTSRTGGAAGGDGVKSPSPRVKSSKVKPETPEDCDMGKSSQATKKQSPTGTTPPATKPSTNNEKAGGGGDEAPAPESPGVDEAGTNLPSVAAAEKKAKSSEKLKTEVTSSDKAGRAQEADESSDEEGDGFRIVVGRDREAAHATTIPVKRFLRGTNTLVNNPGTSSSNASKPVSAAASIASLVPAKGAPVPAHRPSLKLGEYPPTAELQRASGKTAFDVDIDAMEEQPWRHPGVDVADFFNYGFTEDSWRVYCEKQLRNRYDQTLGRPKPGQMGSGGSGSGGGGGGGSHMRHGGGNGPRRGDRTVGLDTSREHSMQLHNNGPGRPSFPAPVPGVNDQWGPGPRPNQFADGFGPVPPHGNLGRGGGNLPHRPWFDGPSPMYQGGGRNMPPGSGGMQDQGGGMGRWKGDRQDKLRQQGGMSREGRLGGDNADQRGPETQDMRPRDSGRDGPGAGRKRSRSPVPLSGLPGGPH